MADKFLENVLVRNPTTGQTMTATRKQFDSIYRDKGFELVERGNAEKPPTGKPKSTKGGVAAGDNIGSAADVAASMGVTGAKTEGDKLPTGSHVNEAGKRVVGEKPAASDNVPEGVNAGGNAESGVAEGGADAVDPNANQPVT